MQSKNENLDNRMYENDKPRDYHVYFEMRLDEDDFGKDRKEHNTICNQQLLAHLEKLSVQGIELYETVSNAALMKEIKENPHQSPDDTLTWHHCHSTTVGGVRGVMHLVLDNQHTDKALSNFFHPFKKGGYFEWAVPKGAPVRIPNGYPDNVSESEIQALPVEKLGSAFLVAVGTNNLNKFNLAMERAKELKLSDDELTSIITKNYPVGVGTRQENLLHIATTHGYPELIKPLLTYFTRLPNFPQLVDSKGNTPAHIAAKRKRETALKKLIEEGIDLNIKNKKNQTAYNIAQEKNHTTCMAFCAFNTDEESQSITREERQECLAKIALNFEFLYGDKVYPTSSASKLNVSSSTTSDISQVRSSQKRSSESQIRASHTGARTDSQATTNTNTTQTAKSTKPDLFERLSKMTPEEREKWRKQIHQQVIRNKQQAAAEKELKNERLRQVYLQAVTQYLNLSAQNTSVPNIIQSETSKSIKNIPKQAILSPNPAKESQVSPLKKSLPEGQRLVQREEQVKQKFIKQSHETIQDESKHLNTSNVASQRFFQPSHTSLTLRQLLGTTHKTVISHHAYSLPHSVSAHSFLKRTSPINHQNQNQETVQRQQQAQQQQKQQQAQQQQGQQQAQQQQKQQQAQQQQKQQQAQQQQRQQQAQQQQKQQQAQQQQK
ncbi:ankyrin repeat domain-containing protein, partial [Legionella sp.]|uniref:ankyrin repeat domain-containing protein n=1 Tax=Legionella sp. TaxID=459 RepID=UPI003CC299B8